jgi:hypothetical protein
MNGVPARYFDEYIYSKENTMHVEVTDELRDWILAKLCSDVDEHELERTHPQRLSGKFFHPLQPGNGLLSEASPQTDES